ncbi:MAG: pyruvate kinase, partial [Alphaproteobacteria bacterium]|nr:pyruvate kinase [Alphaproteobacteria bacterium]
MTDKDFRFTKIVATIGPVTSSYESLKAVIEAGVDICRFNFSHDTHEAHKAKFDIVKRLEKELGKRIPVFADLQGPKLRLGTFKEGSENGGGGQAQIVAGQEFTFDSDDAFGDSTRVKLPHPEILESLDIGHVVLIDDGKLKVQVVSKGKGFIKTKVIVGGTIRGKKGFNLPDTIVPLPVLTEKDLKDMEFALSPAMGVDMVAVSFAQSADDMRKVHEAVRGRAAIINKIEKPSAITPEALPEIVELSDIVMIARGDLGVEIGPEKVPAAQKRMIKVCRDKRRPVIVATQMLESMVEGAFPTRAEVTDVANAVYEGTDCTMLSAETTLGKYPVEAVKTMSSIIKEVEKSDDYGSYIETYNRDMTGSTISDAMALATMNIVKEVKAKAVVAFTTSGTTAINISKRRPNAPIVAVSSNQRILDKIGMSWGVIPVLEDASKLSGDKVDEYVRQLVKDRNLATEGDHVV